MPGSASKPLTSAHGAAGGKLDPGQRRVLLGVCIALGAATTVPASYNFVLIPMLHGLHASETEGSVLRQLPTIAGLLVIFLVGILGRRWGERRFISWCSAAFTAGNTAVAIAPGMGVAAAGLVLETAGASGLIVVTLALLSATVPDEKARASAFAFYATAAPVVYVTMPLLAGVIVDDGNWRLVPGVWALSGVVMLISARAFLPASEPSGDSRELLTPALAGVALTGLVQAVTFADRDGLFSAAALVRFGITLAALLALYLVYRRTESPSLSLAALRQGGMLLLMVIIILLSFANLWFYLTVGLQFIYGLDVLQTAAAMLPAQLAGIGGAMIARAAIPRAGITVTGIGSLAALALSLLLSTVITVGTPIWVPIVVLSCYAVASVAATVPLTAAIMNLAPAGEEGSASAFRSAARNIGAAVGVVVMSAIVFSAFSASLSSTLRREGLNSSQAEAIAERIRDGVASEQLAAEYAVPLSEVTEIAAAQRAAMADGLDAHGLSGAAFTGLSMLIFFWSRRRSAR